MSVQTTSASAATAESPAEPDKVSRFAAVALGLLTILYGMLVLSLRPVALASIAVLAAIALFSAGFGQLFLARTAGGGWRWLGYLSAVLMLVAGVLALFLPVFTLFFLALVVAWSFVINGAVRVVTTLVARHEMWVFGFVVGILELLIGMWAIASPGREVLLLVNIIGIFLIFSGVDAIVTGVTARPPATR